MQPKRHVKSAACGLPRGVIDCVSISVGIVLGLLIFLAGCSSGASPKKSITQTAKVPLVWPAPPEQPRIAYVKSVHGPSDVGIKRSRIARFARWVVGTDKTSEEFAKPFGVALDENGN